MDLFSDVSHHRHFILLPKDEVNEAKVLDNLGLLLRLHDLSLCPKRVALLVCLLGGVHWCRYDGLRDVVVVLIL